jgi:hypothetical protein
MNRDPTFKNQNHAIQEHLSGKEGYKTNLLTHHTDLLILWDDSDKNYDAFDDDNHYYTTQEFSCSADTTITNLQPPPPPPTNSFLLVAG